ncbi:hypothetical protein BBJ28_00003398 [Nothophytophthora sp. Chile5]|nr:hypothetical protein BBJ28_00003398 [Nothophytophthora sp. Chile5]
MTDALFLEDVVGFLRDYAEPTLSEGLELGDVAKEVDLFALPGSGDFFAVADCELDDIHDLTSNDSDLSSAKSECSCVEAVSSSQSTPVTASESVRSKDAVRRSTYREKQKRTRDELYCQVAELSAELVDLQGAEATAKAGGALASSRAVWKALVRQQAERRLVSEELQKRLYVAVHERAALIEDLGLLMHKRLSSEQFAGEGANQKMNKRPRVEPARNALFSTYLQELDEVYARTDEVFDAAAESTIQGCINIKHLTDEDTGHLQFSGNVSVPFPFERTCRALWQLEYQRHRWEDRELYDGVDKPENTMAMKFRISCRQKGGLARSLVQHIVIRRYMEEERMVIVWRKFTEGEGAFAGFQSDETIWHVIRPTASSLGGGTNMEACVRYVPMHLSSAVNGGAPIGQYTRMALGSGEEDCTEIIRRLEEILLDEVLSE